MTTIGSLFSGARALCELAVVPLVGGRVVWHSEIDPAACALSDYRFPDVPNLGDIAAVDWSEVERVDVLCGGFPCTDVSSAGKRLGLRPDTRSGLWSHMAYAIGQLRPELVVIENVRGLASSPAHSDVEPCPWCVGDGPDVVALRALGAVLGDLCDLGYDAVWCGLRASDVGAPHPRFRFVILAAGRRGGLTADTSGPGRRRSGVPRAELRGPDGPTVGRDDRQPVLLPTPRATDGTKGGPNQRGSSGDLMLPSAVMATDWGKYGPAIERWEVILGHPAPSPTITGQRGGRKLNPALAEWMMGWPPGWVTEVPGLTPNDQLRLCGNGVVSQQIQAGIRFLAPLLSSAPSTPGGGERG